MKIYYHLDKPEEKITNFNIAESITNFCDEVYNVDLDAEAVAKMILIQIDSRKVVEVVRCKDCKRYIKGHAGEQSNYCSCHTTTFEKFFCMPNDYCSCGERNDNNG